MLIKSDLFVLSYLFFENFNLFSNNHKLTILDRNKQRAEYKQQERLNHILAIDDKKRITKDITKKLK